MTLCVTLRLHFTTTHEPANFTSVACYDIKVWCPTGTTLNRVIFGKDNDVFLSLL